MRILSLIILIVTFNTLSFAKTTDYIYTEDKTGITATSDHPQFKIKLKSNPTTGYSWFLREYDRNLILPLRHKFEAPADKRLIGAPGYEIWTFRVKPEAFAVPQQMTIRFIYSRPWQGSEQAKSLTFRISTISVPSTSHSQKSR